MLKTAIGKINKTIAWALLYIVVKWTVILVAGSALYKSGYWSNWYFLLIPALGITAFTIRKFRKPK